VKVLAKLGLVTAAAATVLFIFIYEFQGPVINRVMSEPPVSSASDKPLEDIDESVIADQKNSEEIKDIANTEEELPEQPVEAEVEDTVEPLEDEQPAIEQPAVTEEQPVVTEEQPVVTEEAVPTGPTRRIYGKITLSGSGEQLGGVNIMVPGSTVAKVSNPNGGYTIEITERTRELVFIYRGKKLTHRLSQDNSLLNVALDLEKMRYD
jgi:hypothetical protein